MINFSQYVLLKEGVGLSRSELLKPNSATGESRFDILLRAIESETELVHIDNSTFIITHNKDNLDAFTALKAGDKSVKFKAKTGSKNFTILSSKIAKSEVFGGAAGSKTGKISAAETTAIGESGQCYLNSLAGNILGRNLTEEDYTIEHLEESAKFCDCDRTPKQVFDKMNPAWISSGIVIANKMKSAGFLKKGNKYHRGSKFMSSIYKAAAIALKASGYKLANDKWNPGDIWVDGTNGQALNQLDSSSISSFNDDILRMFDSKTLVGVSLKLAKGSAKIDVFNKGLPPPPHEVDRFLLRGIGKKSSFFSNSKASIVLRNGIAFEGRAFQFMTNYSFEILGKNARGGKIGFGIIVELGKRNGIKLDKNVAKSIKGLFSSKKPPTDKFLKAWWHMYGSTSTEGKTVTYTMFKDFMLKKFNSGNKNDLNWMWSKYIGTYFIFTIKAAGSSKSNQMVTDMINHAKSSTADSSVFIKVS